MAKSAAVGQQFVLARLAQVLAVLRLRFRLVLAATVATMGFHDRLPVRRLDRHANRGIAHGNHVAMFQIDFRVCAGGRHATRAGYPVPATFSPGWRPPHLTPLT